MSSWLFGSCYHDLECFTMWSRLDNRHCKFNQKRWLIEPRPRRRAPVTTRPCIDWPNKCRLLGQLIKHGSWDEPYAAANCRLEYLADSGAVSTRQWWCARMSTLMLQCTCGWFVLGSIQFLELSFQNTQYGSTANIQRIIWRRVIVNQEYLHICRWRTCGFPTWQCHNIASALHPDYSVHSFAIEEAAGVL